MCVFHKCRHTQSARFEQRMNYLIRCYSMHARISPERNAGILDIYRNTKNTQSIRCKFHLSVFVCHAHFIRAHCLCFCCCPDGWVTQTPDSNLQCTNNEIDFLIVFERCSPFYSPTADATFDVQNYVMENCKHFVGGTHTNAAAAARIPPLLSGHILQNKMHR